VPELRYLLKWKAPHGEYQPTWISCEAHKGSGRFINGMLQRIGSMLEFVLVLALSLLF
jgi:hypothetical protein